MNFNYKSENDELWLKNKKTVEEFLQSIMKIPVEFQIQHNPQKIWISNKSSSYQSNGFYFNPRLGPIWKTPIVVITPIISLNDWLNCKNSHDYIFNDLSNRGLGISDKTLPQFKKMNGITSSYLREMFEYKYHRFKPEYHPDFKFDFNDEQSQFLFKLNNFIKEISRGVFFNSEIVANPSCGDSMVVNYINEKYRTKDVEKIKSILQKKYPKIQFKFQRVKEDPENFMDLRWSDLDPKNWDRERKEIEAEKTEQHRISSFENFKKDSQKKYGEIYEYSLDNFVNMKTPITIFCKKHKLNFDVTPQEHLNGKRCPRDIESKGENLVRGILTENKIEFKQYYKFKGCFSVKNNRCYLLTFDFYIPSKNTVIEYDGGQHFAPVSIFGGEKTFERTKMLDAIKNKFCKDNNIKMIRIPYTMSFGEIETYLINELSLV